MSKKKQVWKAIDSAPKDGTEVLLHENGTGMFVGFYVDGGSPKYSHWKAVWLEMHGCGCCVGGFPRPEHWMPLPCPPELYEI